MSGAEQHAFFQAQVEELEYERQSVLGPDVLQQQQQQEEEITETKDDDDDDDDDESPLEKVVIDELQKEKKVDAPIKEARNALRDRCNVSLTNREILEAQRRASRTTTITK